MRRLFSRSQGPKAETRAVPMTRPDRLFLLCFAIFILAVQTFLLSPHLQSLIPLHPTSSLRMPSVTMPEYTEYRSTFSCLPTQSQPSCAIHAKYNFNVLASDQGSFGILVADYNGTLQFLVNGQSVESHGPNPAVQRLMFGLPNLVVFPDNILKLGTNSIEMTVTTDLPLGALIHRVYIGKMSAIQDIYNSAFVLKWTVPRLVEGMLIATWIFCAYVVLWHGLTEYNSVFAFLTFICLSIFSVFFLDQLNSAFRILPMFLRLSAATFIGVILAEKKRRVAFISLKYLVLVPLGLAAMVLQSAGTFQILIVFQSFWVFLIILAIIGLGIKIRWAFIEKDIFESVPIVIAAAAITINAFNVLAAFGYLNSAMVGARGYVIIVLVFIIAIKIFKTFSRNLLIARAANETLKTEIARAREELASIYSKENMQRQQMTVQLERERLMGDLHDGLAGNLISINALAEHGKPTVLDEIRRLSKLALLDLRLVVDSLDTFDGELAVALAAFKERITPQYSGTPIKISWDTEHAPMITTLRPEVNLAIFRILQEAIANSVRHGRATRVHILVRASRYRHATASIWVLDNGTAAGLYSPGFGMRNMQRRAEKINGSVHFRLHKDGSAVLLNI